MTLQGFEAAVEDDGTCLLFFNSISLVLTNISRGTASQGSLVPRVRIGAVHAGEGAILAA